MIHVFFYVVKQISTQQEDYLIDTIALHDSMEILRPVFADPSICKVCKLSLSCFFQGERGVMVPVSKFSLLSLISFNEVIIILILLTFCISRL